MFSWLCGFSPSTYLGSLASRLFVELTVDVDEPADAAPREPAEGAAPDAERAPLHALRFDLEEISALRRAHRRGDADGGLTRDHLHEAFGQHLPAYAIERLFVALARPVQLAPPASVTAAADADAARSDADTATGTCGEGSARSPDPTHPPQLRIGWVEWVDGLATLAKPPGGARTLGTVNAPRLLALFDLFASERTEPSTDVLALDEQEAAAHAFHAGATYAGAFPARAADERARMAALEAFPPGSAPAARACGALDAPCLVALLTCCMRQCVEPARLAGASADFAPVVADALVNGALSRSAWLRWASAAVPRLGCALELLVLRGVCALARDAVPTHSAARLAHACWLPHLVGGEEPPGQSGAAHAAERGASAEPASGAFGSRLLPPALLWAVCLALPPHGADEPHDGGACAAGAAGESADEGWPDVWRLLYSSAEHGLAMNRLTKHVVGYAGATLLVVQEAPPLGSRTPSAPDATSSPGGDSAAPALLSAAATPPPPPPPPPMRWATFLDVGWHAVAPGRAFGGDGCVAYELAPRFHPHRVAPAGARHCASLVLPVHALLTTPSHQHHVAGPAAGAGFALGASRAHRASESSAGAQPLLAIGGGPPSTPHTPRTPATPSASGGASRAESALFGAAAVNAAVAGAQQQAGAASGVPGGGAGRQTASYRAALTADLTCSLWRHSDETYEVCAQRATPRARPRARAGLARAACRLACSHALHSVALLAHARLLSAVRVLT